MSKHFSVKWVKIFSAKEGKKIHQKCTNSKNSQYSLILQDRGMGKATKNCMGIRIFSQTN